MATDLTVNLTGTVEEIGYQVEGILRALVSAETELEVVTRERDNALLRIEELERQIPDHRDYWGQWIKGGVHPNA